MTLKESYDIAGYADDLGQSGVQGPDDREDNALAVERLVDAGVDLFGKTNVPLILADWQSYNEIYGVTNNPWDLSRTPGGSSGGSARGAGRRPDRHRGGQRHRRLDPQPGALLRRVRPQADLRRGLAARPCARRQCRAGRHHVCRAAGAQAPTISRSRWT